MPEAARRRAGEWTAIAAVFGALVVVAGIWLAIDRHPPEWDYANHLERALLCADDLARGDVLTALRGRSSFYPPLVPCAAGLVFRVRPSDVVFGQVVVLAFLGVGMAATYVIARRWAGGAGGVLAAALFGAAPFVVHLALRFQLDLPLASMVALFLAVLLAGDGFRRPTVSLAAGLVFGLGMLTKPPFVAYVAAPLAVVLAGVRGRARWLHAVVAALVAVGVAIPWYGPRLLGMPAQVQSRSFRQAAESGFPEALSVESLVYYPLNFPAQFGVAAVVLFAVGVVVALWRRRWFVLAGLVPLVGFLLLQNKQLRYTLPLLPMAAVTAAAGWSALPSRARRVAAAAVALVTVAQVASTAFGVPAPPSVAGVPLTPSTPPRADDWQHRAVLSLVARDAGGRPATVSVVPNNPWFSPANFRYYAVRDRLSLEVARAWDDEPIGIEYMILKSGDVGPPWTAGKPRRIAERLAGDAALAGAFPVIGEFALPDGSTASVRARRVPVVDATPEAIARGLTEGLRRRAVDVAVDLEGLDIRLDYDASIRGGRVKGVELSATAATLGDMKRRNAARLRVRDLRIELADLLANPTSALSGSFEPLDLGALRLARATIDASDLRTFLAQGRDTRGTSIALGPGYADVSVRLPGPDVGARIRLAAADDRPFVVIPERVTLGGVVVPPPLVRWIASTFDPSARIAHRLPFPVTIGRPEVTPDAIHLRER